MDMNSGSWLTSYDVGQATFYVLGMKKGEGACNTYLPLPNYAEY